MSRKALDSYPFDTATPTRIIDLKEGPITNPHRPEGDDWECHRCGEIVLAGWTPSDLASIMTIAPAVVLCPICGFQNLMPGTTIIPSKPHSNIGRSADQPD